jgi:hypothetical protein
MSGSEGGAGTGNTDSLNTRSQSPNRSFAHRAIMGGAADFPQRSSSPLKRPASDLEQDPAATPDEDVEMDAVSSSGAAAVLHDVKPGPEEGEQSRGSTSLAEVSRASSDSQPAVNGEKDEADNATSSPEPNKNRMCIESKQ